MYILKECWNFNPVAFLLVKRSPYRESFSDIKMRLIQAGLIKKWHSDERDKVARLSGGKKELNVRKLIVNDLVGPLGLHLTLLALATCAFCLENVHHLSKRSRRKMAWG